MKNTKPRLFWAWMEDRSWKRIRPIEAYQLRMHKVFSQGRTEVRFASTQDQADELKEYFNNDHEWRTQHGQ